MPNSFIPTRLNDLTVDVSLSGVARGDVLYRGASKWNNLAPGTSGKFLRTNGAGADPTWETAGVTDHGALTGLSDDDHTIYALLAGRSGGQTINGDTASGGNIRIDSTAHGTKGRIDLNGTSTYVASNGSVTSTVPFVTGFNGSATNNTNFNQGDANYGFFISTQFGTSSIGIAANGTALLTSSHNASNPGTLLKNTDATQTVLAVRGFTAQSANYIECNTVSGTGGDLLAVSSTGVIGGSDGSGTNVAGGSRYIAGGRPTGSANGGSVIIQTAAPGASGTTLRDLVDRVTVDTNGLSTFSGNISANKTGSVTIGTVSGSMSLTMQSWSTDANYLTNGGSALYIGCAGGSHQTHFLINNSVEASIGVDALTLADGTNVVLNTTTGTKIGTATSQKIGFWNATPIVQPASANQAALTLDVDVTGADTVDKAAINTNFTAIQTLVNQLRSDLVAAGLIKGAA